jgi:aminoglycoside phosphotransferase (APT) family kinase protein
LEKTIGFAEVSQICAKHRIEIKDLRSTTGSFDKQIFFINDELLLRVSATTMAREQEQFRRVAALQSVPHIKHVGVLEREAGPVYYTLLTLLPGDDFVNVYFDTTIAQQKQLGKAVAEFLDSLHSYHGTRYDIGLYVPAIPEFSGTWCVGHQHYWERLEQGAATLQLQPESRRIFVEAFQFLNAFVGVLDYQTGPTVLHNDFHPKNILLHQGRFSGVIDWECSQYGEADFDLCHLIHWCVYPPHPDVDFRAFLRAVFQAAPRCMQVPELAKRLTLYQLEHEIQQIVWQGHPAEVERVPRIVRWLEGGVEDLLREVSRT